MNHTTETLAKSLAGVGVLLAVPALAAVLFGLLHLSLSLGHTPPNQDTALAAVVVFLASAGLFLLWRTIAFARGRLQAPSPWLWPTLTGYLLVGVGAGVAWTLRNYGLARRGELRSWGGDELDTTFALWPVSFLLLPACALVLSAILWAIQSRSRTKA